MKLLFDKDIKPTAPAAILFLALLVFTQQIYYRHFGVRRPFVFRPSIRLLTHVSQKMLHGSRPNFYGKLPIRHIFFCPFTIFNFQMYTIFLCLFSLIWNPMKV